MNDIWPTTHGGPLDKAAQTAKTAHSAQRTAHTQPAMKPVRGRSRSSFPVGIFGDLANDFARVRECRSLARN
jgi:hypothetical protein